LNTVGSKGTLLPMEESSK